MVAVERDGTGVKVSIVIVAYNMSRELPKTIRTLSPLGQNDVKPSDYEIVIVDNGSREQVRADRFAEFGGSVRVLRMEAPSQSPAPALNCGAAAACGEIIVSMIDGARMVTPGCVSGMLNAFRLFPRCVVTTPAWHIGPDVQNESVVHGYDQAAEDRLLKTIDWEADGYRLFEICARPDQSCPGLPWFDPLCEANFIGLHKDDYARLGGFDEAFSSRGGGAVNLDMLIRACADLDRPIVSLLGEGSFHQIHGGVSTNVSGKDHPWEAIHEEYRRIRGKDLAPPFYEAAQIGRLGPEARRAYERARALVTRRNQPRSLACRLRQAAAILAGR